LGTEGFGVLWESDEAGRSGAGRVDNRESIWELLKRLANIATRPRISGQDNGWMDGLANICKVRIWPGN